MIRSLLNGNLTSPCHVNPPPAAFFTERSSGPVVMIMIHPESDTRCDAADVAASIRSTARKITQSKVAVRFSARSPCTVVLRAKLRTASLRKAAFLFWDSASVIEISGRHRAIGIPGNPGPEPKSSSVRTPAGTAAEQAIDSTKWRETISSGSRIAVRLVRAFQRNISERYLTNRSSVKASSVGSPSRIRSALSRPDTGQPLSGARLPEALMPELLTPPPDAVATS
jgi:hypothetical protein